MTDHLGTVRDLAEYDAVSGDTTVVNHIVYDAFGRIVSETDPGFDFLYGFTGRERDGESDLHYNRARYYDVTTGRWLSQDPIGFAAGDANLYRYVGNQPTTKTDPSGLEETIPIVGPDGELWEGPIPKPLPPWYDPHAKYVKGVFPEHEYPNLLAPKLGPVDLSHRNGVPYHLFGTWAVSICVESKDPYGDHAWIEFRNVRTGEHRTAGVYAFGFRGVTVPGTQMDNDKNRVPDIKRTIILRHPPVFYRDGYGGSVWGFVPYPNSDKIRNNCATYARDAWYQYTGEFFWFETAVWQTPYNLMQDIIDANEEGPVHLPDHPDDIPDPWEG